MASSMFRSDGDHLPDSFPPAGSQRAGRIRPHFGLISAPQNSRQPGALERRHPV